MHSMDQSIYKIIQCQWQKNDVNHRTEATNQRKTGTHGVSVISWPLMKRQTETPIAHFVVEHKESNEIRSLVKRLI